MQKGCRPVFEQYKGKRVTTLLAPTNKASPLAITCKTEMQKNLPLKHDRYCQTRANQISLFLPSFSILSECKICFNYNCYIG